MKRQYTIHDYLQNNLASRGIEYTWGFEKGNLRLTIPSLEFSWLINPLDVNDLGRTLEIVEQVGAHMGILGVLYDY